jgi:predicted dehydrogenase
MDRICVATIGCGGIAKAHAKAYAASLDLCQIVACADVVGSAAQAFGGEFGCAAYLDTAKMLDAVKPDAVSICSPPSGHLPAVRLAAERGIAVLCEKPLARNLAEANEMVEVMDYCPLRGAGSLCGGDTPLS